MKKKILILALLVATVAGYFGWRAYNKPVPTLHDVKPEIEIPAEQLFSDFTFDEETANQKYLGKVIRITGKLMEINLDNKDYSTVYLDSADPMGSVSCQLEKGEEAKLEKIENGQQLVIKGKCTGFAMDVVLTQCIIEP